MIRIIIGVVALSLSMSSVRAQLTESDTLTFGYRANVAGSWITGNVERLLINSNLDLSHVGKTVGIKSSNSYIYGTIFKRETENDIFSRNFFYLYPRKRLYPYAMLWLQNSERQKIEYRYQAGVGLSYGLIHTVNSQLKISGTITHEETRYNGTNFITVPENVENDKIKNWRGTVRLLGHFKLPNKKVQALFETWYQPALDDPDNWRYLLNAALDVPLFRHFSFRSSLLYSYENIVLVGVQRKDTILTFGFTVTNF
jgi:Protein of unknown function, DUF481